MTCSPSSNFSWTSAHESNYGVNLSIRDCQLGLLQCWSVGRGKAFLGVSSRCSRHLKQVRWNVPRRYFSLSAEEESSGCPGKWQRFTMQTSKIRWDISCSCLGNRCLIGTPQSDQPTQDVGITSDNFCQLKGSYLEVLSTHFLQSERGKLPSG